MNGRTGTAFRKNEGFHEFDVELRKRRVKMFDAKYADVDRAM